MQAGSGGEPVTLTGRLEITLNNGATVSVIAFTGQTSATVVYTIGADESTATDEPLTIETLLLAIDATATDAGGRDLILDLPAGANLADLVTITVDAPADSSGCQYTPGRTPNPALLGLLLGIGLLLAPLALTRRFAR